MFLGVLDEFKKRFYDAHNVRNAQNESVWLRGHMEIHAWNTRATRTTRTTCCGTEYHCWGGGVGVGRVLTVGYPAYAVVPPWFALVPWVGMAEAPPP